MSEVDVKRLEEIDQYWYLRKEMIAECSGMKQAFIDDVDYVFEQARRVQVLEKEVESSEGKAKWYSRRFYDGKVENEQITDLLVQMRNAFTEQDELAEGHGMDDAVTCPIAVAQYALNKFERTIEDNKRFREAIRKALESHKWNNEESAQILEKALGMLK